MHDAGGYTVQGEAPEPSAQVLSLCTPQRWGTAWLKLVALGAKDLAEAIETT